MNKLLNFLFPKLMCRHEIEPRGFSYIRCKKECGFRKYNPEECGRLNSEFMQKLVDSGRWSAEGVNKRGRGRGIYVS